VPHLLRSVFYSGGDFELANTKMDNCRMHFRAGREEHRNVNETLRTSPGRHSSTISILKKARNISFATGFN